MRKTVAQYHEEDCAEKKRYMSRDGHKCAEEESMYLPSEYVHIEIAE
jgi:hypothetical protein